MKVAARVCLFVLTALMATAIVRTPIVSELNARATVPTAAPLVLTESASAASIENPADRDPDANLDLYGNDVSNAVAQYKLDPSGSLYELHSPQTQLPRLGSPKS